MYAPCVIGCASEMEQISSVTVEVSFVVTGNRTRSITHGCQHNYSRRAGDVIVLQTA
jgi:hypothetical protein